MRYIFMSLILLITAFFGAAFAQNTGISDVETAVIREDYKKANDLARDLLKGKLSREDAARAGYYVGLSDLRLGNYIEAYNMFRKVVNERPSTALYEKAADAKEADNRNLEKQLQEAGLL